MTEEVKVEKATLTIERMALAGIGALLAWNVYTTSLLVTDVAVTNVQLSALERSIQAQSIDRYTKSEATSDKAFYDQRLNRLESWSQNLSNRLADLENDVRDKATQ